MSEPKVHVPQRWWWVVAVIVPLGGGALVISPKIIELFQNTASPPPISSRVVIGESSVRADNIVGGDLHEGDEIRTQIALYFGATTPNLSPEERETLDRALDRLKRGDYEGAIPVLQAVAKKTPTPSLLNNLAAAHLAVGETATAQRIIDKARALEGGTDLDIEAALNWNERRLAQARTFRFDPITAVHATRWEGIEVFLTRVEDTGGMVTVEAIYRNAATEPVSFCPWVDYSYVIDERAKTKWDDHFRSDTGCNITIEPAASFPVWIKFAFDVAEHPRVTVILYGVLPFENIEPSIGERE